MKKININKRILIPVLVLSGAVAAGGAWAAKRDKDHAAHIADKVVHELSLNNAQEQQVQALVKESMDAMQEMRDARQERMREVWLQSEVSAADLRGMIDARKGAREEMQSLISRQLAKFHAILTPEQREEFLNEFGGRLAMISSGGFGRYDGHKRGRHGRHGRGWGHRFGKWWGGGHHDHADDDHDKH